MKRTRSVLRLPALALAVALAGACGKTEKPGPLEKAGKSAAEKADKAGEQVSEGAKKMGQVAKETTEGVKKDLQKAEKMPGPTPTRAPKKKWMNE